jgi:hypothetical protein
MGNARCEVYGLGPCVVVAQHWPAASLGLFTQSPSPYGMVEIVRHLVRRGPQEVGVGRVVARPRQQLVRPLPLSPQRP